MLGSLLHSARRALSPGLLATGVFGASTLVAYQLDWLSVMLFSLGIVIARQSPGRYHESFRLDAELYLIEKVTGLTCIIVAIMM